MNFSERPFRIRFNAEELVLIAESLRSHGRYLQRLGSQAADANADQVFTMAERLERIRLGR